MDSLMLRRRAINLNLDSYISFADPVMEQLCVSAWGDGTGLTRRQAQFVTTAQLKSALYGNGSGVSSFNELVFFAGVTGINANTFLNYSSLSSVMFSSAVRTLGVSAFEGCSSLSSINLSNIVSIGGMAFKDCSSLALELNLPKLRSDGLSSYDAFRNSGITKIVSLGNITSMGYYGNFMGCTSLTDVILPATLTSMTRQQFQGCTHLKNVIIYATTPPSITSQNFRDCGTAKIYVPYSEDHSILTAYQTVWGQNTNAAEYDVPRLAELTENGEIPE